MQGFFFVDIPMLSITRDLMFISLAIGLDAYKNSMDSTLANGFYPLAIFTEIVMAECGAGDNVSVFFDADPMR